jgi:hypothetical protein
VLILNYLKTHFPPAHSVLFISTDLLEQMFVQNYSVYFRRILRLEYETEGVENMYRYFDNNYRPDQRCENFSPDISRLH